MFILYRCLVIFFYPLILGIIFLRKIFGKEDPKRYKEKIFASSIKCKRNEKKKLIWFHAASIGEAQSIINLVQKYKKKYEILITTVTKTSAQLISEKYDKEKNVHHRYFPIDASFILDKFLDQWKPSLVLFVDSEIWPNLMMILKKRKIPSILLNARITKKSYKRWKLVSKFAREIFSIFNLCLTSNHESVKYLKDLNAKNIKYFGNLKLSNKIDISKFKNKNFKILKKIKFWCAVSTHRGEDIFFLKTHSIIKKKIKKILTIIIPRHINRCSTIKKECLKQNLSCQILNRNENIDKSKQIIVINSFGNLKEFLQLSKSVFMGKSLLKKFEKIGGQNPIEAAKLGCKIYHGPFTYNFREIYNQLKKLNISKEISNEKVLSKNIIKDLVDKRKKFNKSIIKIEKLGNKVLSNNVYEINKFLI